MGRELLGSDYRVRCFSRHNNIYWLVNPPSHGILNQKLLSDKLLSQRQKVKRLLRDGESNPGLPRDRRGY